MVTTLRLVVDARLLSPVITHDFDSKTLSLMLSEAFGKREDDGEGQSQLLDSGVGARYVIDFHSTAVVVR